MRRVLVLLLLGVVLFTLSCGSYKTDNESITAPASSHDTDKNDEMVVIDTTSRLETCLVITTYTLTNGSVTAVKQIIEYEDENTAADDYRLVSGDNKKFSSIELKGNTISVEFDSKFVKETYSGYTLDRIKSEAAAIGATWEMK